MVGLCIHGMRTYTHPPPPPATAAANQNQTRISRQQDKGHALVPRTMKGMCGALFFISWGPGPMLKTSEPASAAYPEAVSTAIGIGGVCGFMGKGRGRGLGVWEWSHNVGGRSIPPALGGIDQIDQSRAVVPMLTEAAGEVDDAPLTQEALGVPGRVHLLSW